MEDATFVMAQQVKNAKNTVNMHTTNLRDVTANTNQSLVGFLHSTEGVGDAFDNILNGTSGLPCDKKVFENFIKARDLFRELASILKIKLYIDREYLDLLDKFLYFASSET